MARAEIGATTHLKLIQQIAIVGGRGCTEGCVGHELEAFQDHADIMELLEEHNISEQEDGPALRAQAWDLATETLTTQRAKVIAVADQLVQRGRVEASDGHGFTSGRSPGL